MKIGESDAFERRYMAKFREIASQFGEFVQYERDRAARDIGLHLTRRAKTGGERLSSALCWFQLKGIMAATLSEKKFSSSSEIPIELRTDHLQYWWLQPMPTFLVVYVESVDTFLVMNIQKYVSSKWDRAILQVPQKSLTIHVPKDSVLDEQAFGLILRESDTERWAELVGAPADMVDICLRDYLVIFRLATAQDRQVEHRLRFQDWVNKCYSIVRIEERALRADASWVEVRCHVQYMLRIDELERMYPYLELAPPGGGDKPDCFPECDEDEEEYPRFRLSSGMEVIGEAMGGELEEYVLDAKLNSLGEEMFAWIKTMESAGTLSLDANSRSDMDVAPWHERHV